MKKGLILAISALLLVMHGAPAFASKYCSSSIDTYTVELGTTYVPTQSQAGDVLSVTQKDMAITCSSSTSTYSQPGDPDTVWSSSGETFTTPEGIACPILDTGFSLEGTGLGLVWVQRNSASNTWACLSGALMGGSKTRRGLVREGTTILTERFYIVRTSQPLKYGKISMITQSIEMDESDEERESYGALYTININGEIIVESGGCTIESNPVVYLGTVSTKTFRGIGSTSSDVPFSINLKECYGSEKWVGVSFQPVSGFVDAANSVIGIEEGSSAASGIGIQLWFNGEKINTNGEGHIYPLQQNATQLPMTARYYQVSDTVKPGTVESSVIFYIYYE